MEWNELYDIDKEPSIDEILDYIGGNGRTLLSSLIDYMDIQYCAKPKLTYSGCSLKPGWNIKFNKKGKSAGTIYPELNSFSIFMVIGYNLAIETKLLNSKIADLYQKSEDYMKMGKWMMIKVEDEDDLASLKVLIAAKYSQVKVM